MVSHSFGIIEEHSRNLLYASNVLLVVVPGTKEKEFSNDEWVRYVHDDGLDAAGDALLADRHRSDYLVGHSVAQPEEVNDHPALYTTTTELFPAI